MKLQEDEPVSQELRLKRLLRLMPAPVGLVTSYEPETGEAVGLAVSALMPVSLEPCAMAICINRSGSAHASMLRAGRFCINLLNSDLAHHIQPFADPALRSQRFVHDDWAANDSLMYLRSAPAAIFCTIRHSVGHGTHDVVIGNVDCLLTRDVQAILGWANGAPGELRALA